MTSNSMNCSEKWRDRRCELNHRLIRRVVCESNGKRVQRVRTVWASNLDMDGITWTQTGPSKVVATRMTTLARSAVGLAHEAGLELDPTVSLIDNYMSRRLVNRVLMLGGYHYRLFSSLRHQTTTSSSISPLTSPNRLTQRNQAQHD